MGVMAFYRMILRYIRQNNSHQNLIEQNDIWQNEFYQNYIKQNGNQQNDIQHKMSFYFVSFWYMSFCYMSFLWKSFIEYYSTFSHSATCLSATSRGTISRLKRSLGFQIKSFWTSFVRMRGGETTWPSPLDFNFFKNWPNSQNPLNCIEYRAGIH